MKDERGNFAVFSEQGTSASHLMAARFVDAVAYMPGMDGEDADATGAYTQIDLGDDCPPTYISLPKDRWPKHWHGKYDEPAVRLTSNLYGHPLAGLYWSKHCHTVALKCGFEKVIGWECLYKHSAKGLLLSVYVDDFKLGGRRENIAPMWKALGSHLDLDPPVNLRNNV